MRTKKEFWLWLGIISFVLWMITISIVVIDLYNTHHYLKYSIDLLEDSVGDLYDYINSSKGIWL